jgi:drug/metabolite transporter (DMT)-like permease
LDNWRKDWRALLIIGAVNGPQIALNNASLVSIELSLNQAIRAAIPVCVACFAFCLERRVPTPVGAAYLLLVTVSLMCVVFTGSEYGEAWGVSMCAASVLMSSAQMSLSGRLMSSKHDSFQLTFYTGPVAFAVLMAMEAVAQQEMEGLQRFALHKPQATAVIVLGGCILAVMYNVVLMQAVRTFSSVGTAVLGNFRIVLLILLSAILLGELQTWGPTRYLGCLTMFVGAAAYALHPMLLGTPVSRELPRTLQAELDDVRTDPALARQGAAEERYGLATPKESAVSEGYDEVEDDGYLEQARGKERLSPVENGAESESVECWQNRN